MYRMEELQVQGNTMERYQNVKRILLTLTIAGLVCGAARAQEWKLGLGVTYRQFDDVEFISLPARDFGDLSFIFRDGALLDYTPANLAAVIGDLPSQTGAINVVEDVIVTNGYFGMDESVDTSESFAPVLTAEYLFMTEERLTLSAVANFMYFNVDVDAMSAMGLSNTATFNQYFVVSGDVAPLPNGVGSPYSGLTTTGSVSNEFSMDLYELDLGLKVAYSFDFSVDIFAAIGPTLNIVDVDAAVSEVATYSAQGNAGGAFYTQNASDGVTDVLFGVYGAVGGQVWFSENLGFALEARYDEVFDEVDTDFAELDLSGLSGVAKFIFRF